MAAVFIMLMALLKNYPKRRNKNNRRNSNKRHPWHIEWGVLWGHLATSKGKKWAISVRIHGDLPPDLHGSIEPNSREIQRNYQETLFIYRRNSDRRKREEQQAGKLAKSFSVFMCDRC